MLEFGRILTENKIFLDFTLQILLARLIFLLEFLWNLKLDEASNCIHLSTPVTVDLKELKENSQLKLAKFFRIPRQSTAKLVRL